MDLAFLYLDARKTGGYTRDVRWLAGTMAGLGHNIYVVSEPGSFDDGLGSATHVLPADLLSLAREVDFVHSWGLFLPRQLLMTGRARRMARIVISPLCQLMTAHVKRAAWKKRSYLAIAHPSLRRWPDAFHFFSEAEQEESAWYVKPAKVMRVGFGFYPPPEPGKPKRGRGDYLLFFGRNDVYQKSFDHLLGGYLEAVRRGLKLPLVIAGEPYASSSEFLERATRQPELSGRLQIKGSVSESEKWDLLRGARALVYLSRWDGPPRAVREALSVGTPAIVSAGTNMGKLVEETDAGRCVRLDYQEIAAALLETESERRVDSWQRGAEGLRGGLSWSSVAEAYARNYDQLLD